MKQRITRTEKQGSGYLCWLKCGHTKRIGLVELIPFSLTCGQCKKARAK